MTATDHRAKAEEFLTVAGGTEPGSVQERYYLGAAQVHATLAHTEQQRIANLIATEALFTDVNGTTYPLRAWMPNGRIDEIDIALGTWK